MYAGVGGHELDRPREIGLALPEVSERISHGAPCFLVRERRPVCYYHDHHHGDERVSEILSRLLDERVSGGILGGWRVDRSFCEFPG